MTWIPHGSQSCACLPNLRWKNVLFERALCSVALKYSIVVENDFKRCGLAAYVVEVSKRFPTRCVTLGTGVGGGIISDGKPGASGSAESRPLLRSHPEGVPVRSEIKVTWSATLSGARGGGRSSAQDVSR